MFVRKCLTHGVFITFLPFVGDSKAAMKCPFLANMEKTQKMNPIVDTDIICETCNESIPAEAVKEASKGKR